MTAHCLFYDWLLTQRARGDAVGVLASTVAKLPPASVPAGAGYHDWMTYLDLQDAGDVWRDALRRAFHEFWTHGEAKEAMNHHSLREGEAVR